MIKMNSFMKKNYNCPATEVIAIQAIGTICTFSNETFDIGDSINSDPADGR